MSQRQPDRPMLASQVLEWPLVGYMLVEIALSRREDAVVHGVETDVSFGEPKSSDQKPGS